MKPQRRTREHNEKIAAAMRGKNTGPRTREERAAISAGRRARSGAISYARAYREYLRRLELADDLSPSVD